MPVSEKFEPRLATLLDHQRVRAAAKGRTRKHCMPRSSENAALSF